MKTKRHSILIVTAVIFGVLLMIPGLGLAKYPTKPITLVAPYGPGGASDLASRTLAEVAPKYIGEPVLVVNRTGAGGVT